MAENIRTREYQITRDRHFTGVWIASHLDPHVVAEKEFGTEYDAREWLTATRSDYVSES